MGSPTDAIAIVSQATNGIQEGIRDSRLSWLVNSPAAQRCTTYLIEHGARDTNQINMELERYRAAMLLLILAAMQLEEEDSVIEALCPMATRNVGTRGLSPSKRLQRAGEARKRPLSGDRYYYRSGLAAQMQQRLADELYVLISQLDCLETALAEHGEEAVARFL